jgi:hypothetical protein
VGDNLMFFRGLFHENILSNPGKLATPLLKTVSLPVN